jgi:isoleucyl-tRNA synthetase
VASENYQDDVKVSSEILNHVADAYRKMRNTLRFLLSNLYDFDPARDGVALEQLAEIDRWALMRFAELVERVTRAYDRYEFHAVYHALFNFCGTTISSLYMDILKDRLYCEAPDGPERRAAQTVTYRLCDGLLRLMSPILCFTAAEAWEHLHGLDDKSPIDRSIFFAEFPKVDDIARDPALLDRWERLLSLRGAATRALEAARRDKLIGLSLDAEVVIQANEEWAAFLDGSLDLMREVCIVSGFRLAGPDEGSGLVFVADEAVDGVRIAVHPAPGNKCERCWTIATSVGQVVDHPTLCVRCADVVRRLAG